jgi:hypothetical protein
VNFIKLGVRSRLTLDASATCIALKTAKVCLIKTLAIHGTAIKISLGVENIFLLLVFKFIIQICFTTVAVCHFCCCCLYEIYIVFSELIYYSKIQKEY